MWTPQYRVALKKPNGAAVAIASALYDATTPSAPLVVLTAQGALAAVDWAPAGDGTGMQEWRNLAGDAGDDSRILWTTPDEALPEPISLSRHPSITDAFLVVCAGSWSVWRAGSAAPLLVSPPSVADYSVGAWSPTRPGILFIGRVDGVLESWDVLDSLSRPTSPPVAIVSSRLTSFTFRSGSPTKQLLAVGDSNGVLHIVDIPGASALLQLCLAHCAPCTY